MATVKGISEIMICFADIKKAELKNMSAEQLKELINAKLQEESTLLYVYNETDFKVDLAINIVINYQEADITPPISEGDIRLVFWEEFNNGNMNIDLSDLEISDKPLAIDLKGNTYGCLHDWGHGAFETLTTDSGLELFLESESFGNSIKVVYFLNSSKECKYSIADIENNESLSEEFEEMKEDYCS